MKHTVPKLTKKQKLAVQTKFNELTESEVNNDEVKIVVEHEQSIMHKVAGSVLHKCKDEIYCLFTMLKDTIKKDYKSLSKTQIAAIVGTLFYIFSPIDIIPDTLPVLGLLDDASLVGICLKFLKDALETYKAWKAQSESFSNIIGEAALDAVEIQIEPSIRLFRKSVFFWSGVSVFFSVIGIAILLAKPFVPEINNDVAFIVFDISWLITFVRFIIFATHPTPFLRAFWKNWKHFAGVSGRFQKAIGRSVPIVVSNGPLAAFVLKRFGITMQDGTITLDDVFTIKKQLPFKEFNERYPDLFSIAHHYVRQFIWLFASTAIVFVFSSFVIGFLLKHIAIKMASDATFFEILCSPFLHIWHFLR